MKWELYPILAGEFGMVRDDIKFRGGDPAARGMVPSLVYLLKGEGGRTAVIDTGFESAGAAEAIGLVTKREKPLPDMLASMGVKPENVEAVLLTHTHWDHAGSLGLFANARIICQKADWEYAFGGLEDYPASVLAALREAEPRAELIEGDAEVLPGIRALRMGGHTPGSQSFIADTGDGPVLICGDDVMTYRNISENVPVGLCADPARAERALSRSRESGAQWLLPSHDYMTLEYLNNKARCSLQ